MNNIVSSTNSVPIWQTPSHISSLDDQSIHLWWIKFTELSDYLPQLQAYLSPEELQRANKFVFMRDQQHFILARGFLRYLLGKYLATSPAEIEFIYSAHGKPEINKMQNKCDLHFNLSHSNDFLLIACRKQHSVGIDVEFMRPNMEILSLAQHYFSTTEYQALLNTEPSKQEELFFHLWTRKEAIVKNAGAGLSYPLTDVDVLSKEVIKILDNTFYLLSLPMPANYQAAFSSSALFTKEQLYYWHIQELF